MRILNRVLRVDDQGLKWESDPRHVELLGRSLGLEQRRPSGTPGKKPEHDGDATAHEEIVLDDECDCQNGRQLRVSEAW